MILVILRILAIILFLYLTWRNLRDDYKEEDLISYSWLALLVFFAAGRMAFGLIHWGVWNDSWVNWLSFWSYPGIDYLSAYLSFLAITFWVSYKNNWKIWSVYEDVFNSIVVFLLIMLIGETIGSKFDILATMSIAILGIGMVLTSFVKKKYRSFVWYKSGKKGFAFFLGNFISLLLLSIGTLVLGGSVVFALSCLTLGLISLTGLFILGEVFDPLLVLSKRK